MHSPTAILEALGLARIFRVWEKKRGTHRTGSNFVGNLGEALFFSIMFFLGIMSLVALALSQWTDPDPERMQVGFGFWLMVGVLTSFVAIGGGGLLLRIFRFGMSKERRSALAKKATDIDLLSEANASQPDFPNIPKDTDLTNSPGVHLEYRLPCTQSPVWRLTAVSTFCVLSNFVAAVLAWLAFESFTGEDPEWFLALFAIPFAGIGIWSLIYAVKQWWLHTSIGPTHIEISDHPLHPGVVYNVYLCQTGQMTLRTVRLSLVCEEEATFHQGTDIRTERRVIFREQLFAGEDIQIETQCPFEQVCQMEIPADAMHSFQSSHNAVTWRLVVKGAVTGWPLLERTFPVVVFPNSVGATQKVAEARS